MQQGCSDHRRGRGSHRRVAQRQLSLRVRIDDERYNWYDWRRDSFEDRDWRDQESSWSVEGTHPYNNTFDLF